MYINILPLKQNDWCNEDKLEHVRFWSRAKAVANFFQA